MIFKFETNIFACSMGQVLEKCTKLFFTRKHTNKGS